MDSMIRMVEFENTPCLAIHSQVANDIIGMAVGKAIREVAEHITNNGSSPSRAPFVFYHGFDDKVTTMDCGWPVAADIPETDSIKVFHLPGGKAAHVRHVGPYEGLMGTYQKLMLFLEEEGLKAGPMWEYYLNSPEEVLPQELITEIYWLVE